MNRLLRSHAPKAAGLLLAAAALAACQPKPQPASSSASRAALPTMERIALGANACWFKSGDPAFKAYRLAPELNSFSGRPRILLVPRNSPEIAPDAGYSGRRQPGKARRFRPRYERSHLRPHRNRRQTLGEWRQGLLIGQNCAKSRPNTKRPADAGWYWRGGPAEWLFRHRGKMAPLSGRKSKRPRRP
ncbi:hypothetical protein QE433_002679 [Agrobacterium tumefaciens]|nr:hypothetical protein [Agrobacterium tumefaciens]